MKFARNVRFVVKSGKVDEFKRIYENDVVPMLKLQKGIAQVMTLVGKDATLGISLWHDRASAEAFGTSTFPKVLEKLAAVVDGPPQVTTYDVSHTTLVA